jgi:predicted RNA polymerase sigma factor
LQNKKEEEEEKGEEEEEEKEEEARQGNVHLDNCLNIIFLACLLVRFNVRR